MVGHTLRTRVLGLALVLGLATGLSACGERENDSDKSTKPSSSPSLPEQAKVPDCVKVFKAGEQFPEDFVGCMAGGKQVKIEPIICETGQLIYRYQDRFYATNNAPVRETKGPLKDDPQYQRMYRACTA